MINLRHFTRSEFGKWASMMDPAQLQLMDLSRARAGRAIWVSPNPQSLGRTNGRHDESRHNIDRWRTVQAADVFVDGLSCRVDAERWFEIFRDTGFRGIGFYSYWTWAGRDELLGGFHVDCRFEGEYFEPATWGQIEAGPDYVSLEEALEDYERRRG